MRSQAMPMIRAIAFLPVRAALVAALLFLGVVAAAAQDAPQCRSIAVEMESLKALVKQQKIQAEALRLEMPKAAPAEPAYVAIYVVFKGSETAPVLTLFMDGCRIINPLTGTTRTTLALTARVQTLLDAATLVWSNAPGRIHRPAGAKDA